jgi:hypothetical protein
MATAGRLRFERGLGAGWQISEYAQMGIPFDAQVIAHVGL